MSELKVNVVTYIAGYIQRKVLSKIDCQPCKDHLMKKELQCTTKLIERKDLGGLVRPNKELVELLKIADTILENKIKCSQDIFSELNIFKKLSIKSLTVIAEERPNLLVALDHGFVKGTSHKVKILKAVFITYYSMRIKFLCRIQNDSANTLSRHIK